MNRARPRVVVTRKLPELVEERMRALFDVTLNETDAPMSTADIITASADADVLVPTVTDRIDEEVVAGLGERVKLIANFGAGMDHIDMRAAFRRGLYVTNTPGVLTEDTADLTMSLILAAPRRLIEGARVMEEGGFDGWSPTWMLGRRVNGKKLGIVGMGRIGQAVARRARAFGMEIHYHNRKPVSAAIAQSLNAKYWERLSEMLGECDIVSVNCPSTPATYHLLSRPRLERLQPHAFLVNTSRGDVIDEKALADVIEAGGIAGAALDVFEHEPAVEPRLIGRPNVVLIPHMSSATIESRVEMGEKVIINIRVWQDGERPPDRVLPDEVGADA